MIARIVRYKGRDFTEIIMSACPDLTFSLTQHRQYCFFTIFPSPHRIGSFRNVVTLGRLVIDNSSVAPPEFSAFCKNLGRNRRSDHLNHCKECGRNCNF